MNGVVIRRCAFCGGDNVGLWTNRHIGLTTIKETYEVRCYDCHFGLAQSRTKEEAINTWNTRKPLERVIERLEDESNFFGGEPMGALQKAYYCMGIERAIEIIKQELM